jgi:peptidoglycan/LPS O-acetylase OafA/YrhL
VLVGGGAAALLGIAVTSMVLPARVSIPGGSYTCGPPYARYDDPDVKHRWVSESLILKDKHRDVPFDALPQRTCADATRTRVILAAISGGVGVAAAVVGALVATRRRRVGQPDRDEPSPVARHEPGGLRHVTALDGIRGFAVLAVIAFHTGQSWARGGYLGVDIFFVLSGYLITTLLLVEWRHTGSIGLGGFWARRGRRLLPALLLVLVGVAAYALFVARAADVRALRHDALATLGYVANWRFIFAEAGYFEALASPSPLRHMWSLAVEEQFYLVWPVAALALLRRFRSPRALLVVAALGSVASMIAMALLFHPGRDPSRAYYGTDARAHTILIGVVLAVLFVHRGHAALRARSRSLEVAGVVGALFLVWACVTVDGERAFLYRGGSALVAMATAAVIASVVTTTVPHPLARVLSLRPLAFVGLISYGLYLWHWPIVLVITRARTGLTGIPLLGARVLATFAIAFLSWWLVEMPIRRGALRMTSRGVLAPVAVVLTTLVVLVATLPRRPLPARVFGDQRRVASAVPAGFVKPPGPPVRTLLLGDSVAFTYASGLENARDQYGVEVITKTVIGCGIARGGPFRNRGQTKNPPKSCDDWPQRWRDLVDSRDPDIVAIAVGRWETTDRRVAGQWTHIGRPAFDTYLTAELEQAVDLLSSRGARVALFTAPYYEGFERPDGGRWPEDDPRRVDRFNQILRVIARRHPDVVQVVDVGGALSPKGRYTRRIAGVAVRTDDGTHVTPEGAAYLTSKVLPQLGAMGSR